MIFLRFEAHAQIMRRAVICLRNAFRYRSNLGIRATIYATMVRQQIRDGLRCLVSNPEDARALAAAWGYKIETGMTRPYAAPIPDPRCYCVECLCAVPTDYFETHNGRCWHCEHVMTHASPEVADYFESMYQERA